MASSKNCKFYIKENKISQWMEIGILSVLYVIRKVSNLTSGPVFLEMNRLACAIPWGSNSLYISVSINSDKPTLFLWHTPNINETSMRYC
jgi:hypothetical protein